MLEASYFHENSKRRTGRVQSELVPKFCDVRRVPLVYAQVLPLAITRRYQCIVLGASRNILTVGITGNVDSALLDFLQVVTGATAIFPVLIDAQRMRLLITRLEHGQQFRRLYSRAYYTRQLPSQVRLIQAYHER